MCEYGTIKILNHPNITNSFTGEHKTPCIDSCIYDEIKYLNDNNIKTWGCCCGHGIDIPHCLISDYSAEICIGLGYAIHEFSEQHTELGVLVIYLKGNNFKHKREINPSNLILCVSLCSNVHSHHTFYHF